MHRHPAAGALVVAGLIVGALAAPARAQSDEAASAAPAHIAVIDGVAVLERDGRADPASVNVPLLAGDRLRTERGRLEVLFSDGSALDLDQYTSLDIESDTLLRLLDGRLCLALEGSDADGALSLRVDTPGGSVDIRSGGEYRVSLTGDGGPQQVEVKVVRGVATLVTDQGAVGVGAGQRAVARAGAAPSSPDTYNSAVWDAFDSWSDTQRQARLGVASPAYLPEDLQAYGGTFDRYGQWCNDPSYGYVWYPSVAAGWRPYYHGQWSYMAPFGWTWIGSDAWSWPTHHYGRWGYSSDAWFWIPGRRWGAAWVSWLWTPDYVAWCPLGFGGGPLFSANLFFRAGHAYDPRYGAHEGWTVLSRRYFGHRGRAVSVYAVSDRTLDHGVRQRFQAREAPPAPAGVATARATPILQAGGRRGSAVPRGAGVAVPRSGAGAPFGGAAGAGRAPVRRAVDAPRPAAPTDLASVAARARAVPRTSDRTLRIIGRPREPAATPSADGAPTRTRMPSREPVARESGEAVSRPLDRRAPAGGDRSAAPTVRARTPIVGPGGVPPSSRPAWGAEVRTPRVRSDPYAPAREPSYGRAPQGAVPTYDRAPRQAVPSYDRAPRGTEAARAPARERPPSGAAPAFRAGSPGAVRAPRAAPAPSGGGAAPRAHAPSGGTPSGGASRGGSAPRGGAPPNPGGHAPR